MNAFRILLFIIALVGGALLFAYWSEIQFVAVFRDLDHAHSSLLATSVVAVKPSPAVADPVVADETKTAPIEIALKHPVAGEALYSGCPYTLSWEPKMAVETLDLVLVDAGTLKAAGSVASGLAQASLSEDHTTLVWPVGTVWPGEYFLKTTKVNGADYAAKSPTFSILEYPGSCPESSDL